MSQITIVQSSRDHTRLIAYQGHKTLGYIQKCQDGFKARYTLRQQGPSRETTDEAALDLANYKLRVNQICDRSNQSMLNATNKRLSEPTVTYATKAPDLPQRLLAGYPMPTQVRSSCGQLICID